VKNETFHFEIKDLLTQFVAAFDDIIIKRFDRNKTPQQRVQVRYVYAPKERVIYDLVNKAQNLTVPVVAININSISRDESRVFNKLAGFYVSRGISEIDTKLISQFYRTPVPVNIQINMSILTKFQTDLDQIISNFVPYSNPYIILSWKVPQDLIGNSVPQEIRSEVLWDGGITLNYPTDLAANEKYKISGDTAFTIKGWLFPYASNPATNIYNINTNFYVSRYISNFEALSSNSYTYPLSSNLVNEKESFFLMSAPDLTNIEYVNIEYL
jgi:hypothetical protein